MEQIEIDLKDTIMVKNWEGKPMEYSRKAHKKCSPGYYANREDLISFGTYLYDRNDLHNVFKCEYSGRLHQTCDRVKVFKAVLERGRKRLKEAFVHVRAPYIKGNNCKFISSRVAHEVGMRACPECGTWNLPSDNTRSQELHYQDLGHVEQIRSSCRNCGHGASSSGGNKRAGYHSLSRKDLSQGSRFRVGMEVEKEDEDILRNHLASYEKIHKSYGWCIETDGSLNSQIGFEAVSPILDLENKEQLDDHLLVMREVINAEYTKNCGGHIHVSDTKRNPTKLFDECAGYFPLLYALYPQRAKRGYSLSRPKAEMRGAHKNAIMRHDYTLEFRIFPSPRNVETQRWRLDLLRIILQNPATEEQVIQAMTDPDTELFRHLVSGYDSTERYIKKIKMVINITKILEGLSFAIDMPEVEKKIAALLGDKKSNKKVEELQEEQFVA